MDYEDNRAIKTSISIYPEDSTLVKDLGYTPTDFYRKKCQEERERLKMDKVNNKKTEREKRIEYIKGRMAILIIGIICLSISQFQSISLMWKILALVGGGLLCFYSVFDMMLKIMPVFKKVRE